MKLLRITAFTIIGFSIPVLVIGLLAAFFDPFAEYEPVSLWAYILFGNFAILALSARVILAGKKAAWWICQLVLLVNIVISLIHLNCFIVLYLVWGLLLMLQPPWQWPTSLAPPKVDAKT
jgi:hypothetical protein